MLNLNNTEYRNNTIQQLVSIINNVGGHCDRFSINENTELKTLISEKYLDKLQLEIYKDFNLKNSVYDIKRCRYIYELLDIIQLNDLEKDNK